MMGLYNRPNILYFLGIIFVSSFKAIGSITLANRSAFYTRYYSHVCLFHGSTIKVAHYRLDIHLLIVCGR